MITVRIEAPAGVEDDKAAAIGRYLRNLTATQVELHKDALCSERRDFKRKLAAAQAVAVAAKVDVLVIRVYAS